MKLKKTRKNISLHEPIFSGLEKKYLNDCLDSSWVSTSGKYIKKFENAIKKFLDVKHAIACNSGTSSLHISLILAGVKAKDEVIVPTVTFIAPINTVRYIDANPIFMDCDNYLNIDMDKTIEFLKKETIYKNGFTINKKSKRIIKAIIVVHVYGNAVNLEKIKGLCSKRNIKIIEDSSESLGTIYSGKIIQSKHTGTIGDIGCLSFNGNKIITSGGGGMILLNSDQLAKKARYLIKQAKDDELCFIHNSVGYNYAMTNIHAAIGFAQFQKIREVLRKKRNTHKLYSNLLMDNKNTSLLFAPEYSESNYWLNILMLKRPLKSKKNKLMNLLIKNKIDVRPIWQLNHLQKEYKNCQKYKITNAYKMINSSICLPSGYNLMENDLKRIVEIING